jgi:hypothetical protein
LAVDRGIRVFELELGRGGDDLIDMFLCMIVWCGVSRHGTILLMVEREGNMRRIITKEVASRPLNI